MNQEIEGFREESEEPRVDRRTKEWRDRARSEGAPLRAELRADTRPDSVREAELRAQQIMDDLDGSGEIGSELNIPASLAPDGWEYQWRATSVLGKENRHHMLNLLRTGWRAVPASRHPWLMPAGHEGPIEIGGQQLMEIPKILADRRRQGEKKEAVDQIRNSEAMLTQAPPNTGPRDDPGLDRAGLNRAKREYMAPIPVHNENS